MKNMKRGNRREKTKNKFKKVYKNNLRIWSGSMSEEDILEISKKTFNHSKNCSCFMCGNPRKYMNEITIQEKKAEEIEKQQIEEYYSNVA